MTTNLWSCARLVKSESRGRRAVTLVEIMAAILVLSIGLVGILAAIPFGGFRMAQMSEADNSAAVGRNALRIMKANQWANPRNWWLFNYTRFEYYQLDNPRYGIFPGFRSSLPIIDSANGRMSLDVPFFIDPRDPRMSFLQPALQVYWPSGFTIYDRIQKVSRNAPVCYANVAPLQESNENYPGFRGNIDALRNWYNSIFYQQDDLICGYSASEDETQFRPQVESEDATIYNWVKNVASDVSVPSYTGRYSWMACVYPRSATGERYSVEPADVVSADYDVVVFKDRIPGDQKIFGGGCVLGSGYQGGEVIFSLSSARNDKNEPATDIDIARFIEQLEQTRYIMLWGQDRDRLVDGDYPTFARWYKIANYSVDDENNTLRLTLIGPDTPKTWAGGYTSIAAIFYPGAVGVYSDTCTF